MSKMSSSPVAPVRRPLLSDRNYSILKHTAAIGLPAAGALYFALAGIWHLPDAEEVIGTITAVNVFLGALMGVSQVSYNAAGAGYLGDLEITHLGNDIHTTQIATNTDGSIAALNDGDSVKLKVVRQ